MCVFLVWVAYSCQSSRSSQPRAVKNIQWWPFYPWICWIQRQAANLWRTKVINFPFSFIYFSNTLKNGTDAFALKQTSSAMLSHKCLYQQAATLAEQNHREKHSCCFFLDQCLNFAEIDPFLFPPFSSSVRIISPDMTTSLFGISETYLASWLRLDHCTTTHHSRAKNKSKYDRSAAGGAKDLMLDK